MNGMLNWARHEIELALKREKKDCDNDIGFEYVKLCYESAFKAFSSLCEDGHSGMSISITTDILNRLIKKKPLTPINDVPDEWNEAWESHDGIRHYQHKRLSSLFKDVYQDGKIEHNDVGAYECIDEESGIPYHGGGSGKLFYEYFPIEFPYCPPVKKYQIITKEILSDRKNGDFDTRFYKDIVTPDGEVVSIHRYFGETKNGWEEISLEEWLKRLDMHNNRVASEKKEEKIQNGSI